MGRRGQVKLSKCLVEQRACLFLAEWFVAVDAPRGSVSGIHSEKFDVQFIVVREMLVIGFLLGTAFIGPF